MTLLDNPKRQKVMMRKMQRDINTVKKIYKSRKLVAQNLTEEQQEKSWQNVFNENKIIEQLAVFENNNEYLSTNALYLAIMVQYNYTYLKSITVMPNIDWYFQKDEKEGYDDKIQCIYPNCPHKYNPICFMSWVPNNKPEVVHKYKNIMKKDYYPDRAYIMALCDLHYRKAQDNKLIMDLMLEHILPLRKYENENGYVVLPDKKDKAKEEMIENYG